MVHPRRAARDPLKGATLVAQRSRFHGVPDQARAPTSHLEKRFLVSASATQNATTA
jgi:hypothetical protein